MTKGNEGNVKKSSAKSNSDLQSADALPAEWNNFSEADRSGLIFQLLLRHRHDMDILSAEQRVICEKLAEHEQRLSNSEVLLSQHTAKIGHLKKILSDTAASELKVNGIPSSTTCDLQDVADKILDSLSLPALKTDILSIRRFFPRHSKNSTVSPQIGKSNSTDNTDSRFSIVVEFKSKEIKDHVLLTKRKHGNLKFNDIVKGGDPNIITLFEMHPSRIYNLLSIAKKKGSETDYNSVWASNGSVYAQKTKTSEIIPIFSELDLSKLI